MSFNHKTERIKKLRRLHPDKPIEWIAQKIGYGNPPSQEGLDRVKAALTNT